MSPSAASTPLIAPVCPCCLSTAYRKYSAMSTFLLIILHTLTPSSSKTIRLSSAIGSQTPALLPYWNPYVAARSPSFYSSSAAIDLLTKNPSHATSQGLPP
jgi:hypothetical protein